MITVVLSAVNADWTKAVMRPVPDDWIKHVPWTRCTTPTVPVTIQLVIVRNVSQLRPTVDDVLSGFLGSVVRDASRVVTNDTETVGDGVVAIRMCAYNRPPPPLIDSSILSNQKTVSDIVPTVFIHVQVLDALDLENARLLVFTLPGAARVVDERHVHCTVDVAPCRLGWSGAPLGPIHQLELLTWRFTRDGLTV